jgi:hypothetical protein
MTHPDQSVALLSHVLNKATGDLLLLSLPEDHCHLIKRKA